MANSGYRERWAAASSLDHAWFHFAPEALKDQYRDARSEQRTAALQCMMEGEVRLKLSCGELVAYAIRLPFKSGDEIELLPDLIFASQDTEIDWNNSKIKGFGGEFSDVRVASSIGVFDPEIENLNINRNIINELGNSVLSADVGPETKKGRPGTYAAAREVLLRLYRESPALVKMPASRLVDKFNQRYPTQAAAMGMQESRLNERTLRKHLLQFRKELEETGSVD